MPETADPQTRPAEGGIGRRAFMEGAFALGLGATMRAPAHAGAPGPVRGGALRQGLTGGSAGDTLDPARILDSYMANISLGQLRNNLTEIGPDGEVRAELAESWEASPDARTWTFLLRAGVTFHSGRSLTPADVVESFRHHMGADANSAARGLVAQIADLRADGPRRVTFTLTGGNADFPVIVTDYHLGICPALAGGGIDWRSGDGAGGYALEAFEPGQRTLTRRNPDYWKPDAAFFDSVETLLIADATARTSALRSGAIDCMTNLDPRVAALIGRDPDLRVVPTYGNKHVALPMHADVAPFSDPDVRRALKYAIDREAVLEKIAFGYGELGNDHPIGPANRYRATPDEIPQRVHDPERARFHLRRAGLDGLRVDLHIAETVLRGAVDMAVLYAEAARAAGIDINVVREPDDGYWSDIWLKKPFVGSYWGGRPTEDWIFSQLYASGVDWNEGRWSDARFDRLLVEARATLDPVRRREMYVEMQRIVHDDGASVIPVFPASMEAVSARLGLPQIRARNWELDGNKNAERWWRRP